jgi:hypothetical protein
MLRDDLGRMDQQRPFVGIEIGLGAELAVQLDEHDVRKVEVAGNQVSVEAAEGWKDAHPLASRIVDLARPSAGRATVHELDPPRARRAVRMRSLLDAGQTPETHRMVPFALVAGAVVRGTPRGRDLLCGVEEPVRVVVGAEMAEVALGQLDGRATRLEDQKTGAHQPVREAGGGESGSAEHRSERQRGQSETVPEFRREAADAASMDARR